MKFKDILEKVTDDTWIQLDIRLSNMTFSTRHSAAFYKDDEFGDYVEFLERPVESISINNTGTMVLKL